MKELLLNKKSFMFLEFNDDVKDMVFDLLEAKKPVVIILSDKRQVRELKQTVIHKYVHFGLPYNLDNYYGAESFDVIYAGNILSTVSNLRWGLETFIQILSKLLVRDGSVFIKNNTSFSENEFENIIEKYFTFNKDDNGYLMGVIK